MRVPADMRRTPPPKRVRKSKSRGRRRRSPGLLWWLVKWLMIVVFAIVAFSFLLVLPLRWIDPPVTAFMLQDDSGREPLFYEWVDWSEAGDAMPLAVVAAEDQRFAEHMGFDVGSIRKSLYDAKDGRRLRGASTITQQLVKNLYLSPSRSFWRKGIEAWLTVLTEFCLPKQRILELYVNVVELGPGIYGVGAASEVFFGKPAAALSDEEAALLAAVLPNPVRLRADAPSDYVRGRQAWILRNLQRLRWEGWLERIEE
jgi:monofunctional biosynthetic peptidoglycan transglycosylase